MYCHPRPLSIQTNSFLGEKQKKKALHTNAHTFKHMHTAVSNIQAEHTHTVLPLPLIHLSSSYTILLHHSIFIYLFLTLFLEYWTFHPPSIPQKPSPFSPIPPIFWVPFKFSISQLNIRPPSYHTHMLLTSRFAIFVSHIFHPVSLFFSPYFSFF